MTSNCPYCQTEIVEASETCPTCHRKIHHLNDETMDFSDDTFLSVAMNPKVQENEILADRFVVQEEIGEGGTSVVYKALDLGRDCPVALKILRPLYAFDDTVSERFKREFTLSKTLDSPYICRIHDFYRHNELLLFSLDYIKGDNLSELIQKEESVSFQQKLDIVKCILLGVQTAHEQDIIHRDLKPTNVIVTEKHEAVLMDFGFARLFSMSKLTQTGHVLGTPQYMSPEQFMGSEVEKQSDIYSLGVLFYELFTGQHPFPGGSPISVAMRHMQEVPRVPVEVKPTIPQALNAVIMKCLEKAPADRYQTVSEMVTLLFSERDDLQEGKTVHKILFIEDQIDLHKMYEMLFKPPDFKVTFATRGYEGISLANREVPDLVCLDLLLPDIDGFEIIDKLKRNEATAQIPVIVVSSTSIDRSQILSETRGATDFIQKPFDPIALKKRFEEILVDRLPRD